MSSGVALAPLPRRLASLVRIEHTVFALPFAYVGALLAVDGWPGLGTMGWITLAMVGARTLAMSLNRLIDAELDAANPRTAARELPAGVLTRVQVVALCAVALVVYLLAVLQLEPIVRWLWPIPVAMFVVYPYLKRFTWLAHVWLGVVDGLAPVGAWAAVTGELPWEAWALGAAVACWIAGFDLFYALFDRDVDLQQGLRSWATRFGVRGVFAGARAMHAGVVALLAAAGAGLDVGVWYWLGVAVVAVADELDPRARAPGLVLDERDVTLGTVAGLGVGHLIGLDADRVVADRRDLGGSAGHDGLHGVGRELLVGVRDVRDGELRPAGELDRELRRLDDEHQHRAEDEGCGDDEPQRAAGDEREGELARVEVVAESVEEAHQSSPSVARRVSPPAASSARLRSAMVCRRSASPRDFVARRPAPVLASAAAGARNCARPR